MKYNSIGEQLIAKAQELDQNYKPDKFNDMSEAIDIILNNSGGDIWLDITPYLIENEETMSISQEGYELIYNNFAPETENPINKYIGILIMGNKLIFNGLIESDIPDKSGFNFILNTTIDGDKGYMEVSIYNNKSIEIKGEKMDSSPVWYNLGTFNLVATNQKITQEQYNEIKALINSNSLAGIVVDFIESPKVFFPLFGADFSTNTFEFAVTSITTEEEVFNRKSLNVIGCTIKSDLSITFNSSCDYFLTLSVNAINRVIPTMLRSHQENIGIGDGLTVENGVLKTNNIPALPSDASTKTYTLQAVNGGLIWTDAIGEINTILDNINGEVI